MQAKQGRQKILEKGTGMRYPIRKDLKWEFIKKCSGALTIQASIKSWCSP